MITIVAKVEILWW